jgi:hypothetical protein
MRNIRRESHFLRGMRVPVLDADTFLKRVWPKIFLPVYNSDQYGEEKGDVMEVGLRLIPAHICLGLLLQAT